MKLASSMFLLGFCALIAPAQDTIVRWPKIVGVLTAPGIDNPVAVIADGNGNTISQVHSGTSPWITKSGSAHVDLSTGNGAFDVEGLVLVGGNANGTAGPIVSVVGTLVCNAGSAAGPQQVILDSAPTVLSANGNAALSFKLTSIPTTCNSPQFYIRIPQFGLRWIAAGVFPVSSGRSDF